MRKRLLPSAQVVTSSHLGRASFLLTAKYLALTYAGSVARKCRPRSKARSSVEEHHLDTVGVGGSIPPVPTVRWLSDGEVLREFVGCSARVRGCMTASARGIL